MSLLFSLGVGATDAADAETNLSTVPPPDPAPAPDILSPAVFVDADACPVKDEVYRVAQRYRVKVFVVANAPLLVPRTPAIARVVVAAGPDAADDWIAARAGPGTVVVTADVPLAARCVKAGAAVLAPNGRAFTPQSIGDTLATRDLMDALRSSGAVTGGPRPFSPRDRSAFLSALDIALTRSRREGWAGTQDWM